MNSLQRNAVLTAIRFIGVENITDTINNSLLPLLNIEGVNLQENETEFVGIIKNKENEMYIERVSINDKGEIVRHFEEMKVTDIILNSLNALENE